MELWGNSNLLEIGIWVPKKEKWCNFLPKFAVPKILEGKNVIVYLESTKNMTFFLHQMRYFVQNDGKNISKGVFCEEFHFLIKGN